MKTNALKTTTSLLLLSLIAGSINSCKKKEKYESEICELEGKYRIEVKVSKRLPLLPNIPDNLDTTRYVREKIFYSQNYFYNHNQILLDTGENVCCEVNVGGWQRQCPPVEYIFTGVEIIKENNNYYIKGREDISPTFNLPLVIKKDEVSYNVIRDSFPGNGVFIMDRHRSGDYFTSYNAAFRVYSLSLKNNKNDTLVGTWIINEAIRCEIKFPTSNDMYEYSIVEFAEVTFVKED